MDKNKEREKIQAKLDVHKKEEEEIQKKLLAIETLVSEAKKEYAKLKLEQKVLEGKKQVREEDLKEL